MSRRGMSVCAESLEARRLLAATMLGDLDPRNLGSAPKQAVALGSEIYFQATDAAHGAELWKTDGTPAGTVLVRDLRPGPAGSFPAALTVFHNEVFFITSARDAGYALWKTDGTSAGTVKVIDIGGPYAITPPFTNQMLSVNGRLYFTASTQAGNPEVLWVSDGTAVGTRQLATDTGGPLDTVSDLAVLGNTLYFSSARPTQATLYQTTDGAPAHSIQTAGGISFVLNPLQVTASGGFIYWTAPLGANYVWRYDPVSRSVASIAQLDNVRSTTNVAGTLFFVADDSQGITRLWRTSGNIAGPASIEPADAAADFSNPANLQAVGSTLYFTASDSAHGTELWKTDGTPGGTVMVADLTAGPTGSGISNLTASGGKLFFSARTASGLSLWETDGTAGGTLSLNAPSPSGTAGAGQGFTAFGTGVFFAADDGAHGAEPWITDGTIDGTRSLGDLNPGGQSSGAANFTRVGEQVFFTASGAQHAIELWRTDGTPGGTQLVSAINPTGFANIRDLTNVGGTLFFTTTDGVHGQQVWRSDGTEAGTYAITDIASVASTAPGYLTDVNGTLYFLAGGLVWRSDGTAAGTVALCPAPSTITVTALTNLNGHLLVDSYGQLSALNDAQSALVPLGPGATAAGPAIWQPEQLVVGSQMYYIAPGTGSLGFYVTDGTAAGTMLLKNFGTSAHLSSNSMAWFDRRVYFCIDDYAAGFGDLWASDGTPAGTVPVTTTSHRVVSSLTVFNDRLYFVAYDETRLYRVLYSIDGNSSDPTAVAGFDAGGKPLTPDNLIVAGGALFFTQDDPAGGRDLWISDGTPTGTRPDLQTAGQIPGLSPQNLFLAGSHLLFTAADVIHGREPWARDLVGSVSGAVFNDLNNDGIREPGEVGLTGVTVFVDSNANGTLDSGEISAVTDPQGNYTLDTVPTGAAALIREIVPSGWRRTTPSAAAIELVTDQAAAGPVFGNVQIDTVPIDFAYLLKIAQHYGQAGTFATGDLNGDDQVDFSDLLLLAQNYGHSLASSSGARVVRRAH